MEELNVVQIVTASFALLATSAVALIGLFVRKTLMNGGVKVQSEGTDMILVEIQGIRTEMGQLREAVMNHISDYSAHS